MSKSIIRAVRTHEKAKEALNNTSYKEMGEMLQVDDTSDWHIMNEEGEEED